MNFIDYDYYKDSYCGSITKEDFNRVLPKAEAYLSGATHGRIKTADTNVCFALCELCDIFADEIDRKNISSENCDGYSVSYDESDVQGDAWEIVKIYLGNSGYLYGGRL